jgi:hypothetical protein
MEKVRIYLDDIRTPLETDWVICRNYEEFVQKISEVGLDNIELISLDHDLGQTAIREYFKNTSKNYIIDYNNIHEKTGYDCAKWIVNKSMEEEIDLPTITVHSANPVGSANMMGYINNYLKNKRLPQNCIRVQIPHSA